MADPQKVSRALRAMAVACKRTFKSDDEEHMAVAAFSHALKNYTDEAVNLAANEWIATMKWFPTVVEFVELAGKHRARVVEARAALSPANEMIQRYPVGKPGSEGIATRIVIQRMLDAVAKEAPKGYLGLARGYSDDSHPGAGLRAAGHDFNARGEHSSACGRCHLLATIAYEQAVDFVDSELTWERW